MLYYPCRWRSRRPQRCLGETTAAGRGRSAQSAWRQAGEHCLELANAHIGLSGTQVAYFPVEDGTEKQRRLP
eukprot:7584212-Lingulodinium_polyedra.AAC.1